MSRLYFSGPTVLELVDGSRFADASMASPNDENVVAIAAVDPHPQNVAGTFVMAARVNSFGPTSAGGNFVGLWRDDVGVRLYAFTRDNAGAFSDPKLVLSSTLPLRSVSYFPAPDSPSGRLGLVQEAGDEIRLLSLDWYHPQVYPPRR
ncbi:MAG: hypothetical protein ACREPE_02170 [Lysobacter sp.]